MYKKKLRNKQAKKHQQPRALPVRGSVIIKRKITKDYIFFTFRDSIAKTNDYGFPRNKN